MASLDFVQNAIICYIQKEDKEGQRLLYACRNCGYTELAENPKVYRHELMTNIGATAGVVEDIGNDPTLPRSDKECPDCGHHECVFPKSTTKKRYQYDFVFVCLNCKHVFQA